MSNGRDLKLDGLVPLTVWIAYQLIWIWVQEFSMHVWHVYGFMFLKECGNWKPESSFSSFLLDSYHTRFTFVIMWGVWAHRR